MKLKVLCCSILLNFFAVLSFANDKSDPVVKNGLIDLRDKNFNKKIKLDGQWIFYWKQFIAPNSSNLSQGILVDFPVKWNDLKVNGETLPSFGYASYRLKILLPKKRTNLRITLPDIYCAYNIYLNGNLVVTTGKVGKTAKEFVPRWQYKAIDIPIGIDTADIVFHIANFVHYKGGIKDSMYIGEKLQIQLDRRQAEAIDLLLTGCLCMGGLFFLGLYFMGSRDKAILLFSLYCLVYSYRVLGVGNYVLHTLFPNSNWQLTVHLEYLSLFISIGLFALYTCYLYLRDVNKYIIYSICGICIVFSIITLFVSPYYFSQLINPFLVVTVFCIIYSLYIYILAFKRKRPGSVLALLSSIALMLSFAIELLHYWNIVPQFQVINFLGYVCFFFLQSLILSHRVSYQLKNARIEAEQGLVAKSEFLSTMSHEIRTPLNSVIGISRLLLINNPREDQAQQIDSMLFSANNLLEIVNNILDFNKIEAGKSALAYDEMDLKLIAKNIILSLQIYANEKGITLKLNIDEALANKVLGDSTRMTQVLTNLVHNAIKFTPAGFVELTLKVIHEDDKEIVVKFSVEDSGIGIAKAKQQIIFDRFTQADSSTSRSFGGTGLGLAITKRILELQQTTLNVISDEGKGSTFYFTLKFIKINDVITDPSEIIVALNQDKVTLRTNILLVDDNELNVMVAKSFLEKWGAMVDIAENGKMALEVLDDKKHNIILMDLQMPIIDGYSASKTIRNLGIKIPIIALTANLKVDVEQQTLAVGINDVIVKPFLPDDLYNIVKKYT